MSPRFCKSCGSRIKEDTKFCIHCGVAIPSEGADRSLPEDILQTWGGALKTVNEAADRYLPVDRFLPVVGSARFCVNCGIELTRANRKDKTKKCYKCWIKEPVPGVHTTTFHKDSEYANWLNRAGPNIEILSTAATHRGELDGNVLAPWRHGVFRHSSLVVTWRYKQPQPIPVAEPSQLPLQQQPEIDVAEQIEKLGRLRDQGLLTDEEFQSKKEDLLARL